MTKTRVLEALNENRPRLKFSLQPDEWGFFYSMFQTGTRIISVKVLPPADLWEGKYWCESYDPDPDQWIVHLDGQEFTRISRRKNLVEETTRLLEGMYDGQT